MPKLPLESPEAHIINHHRLITSLFPDRRPDWEQKREREFILRQTPRKPSGTDRDGISIDPQELREQIVAAREQLKRFVHTSPSASLVDPMLTYRKRSLHGWGTSCSRALSILQRWCCATTESRICLRPTGGSVDPGSFCC